MNNFGLAPSAPPWTFALILLLVLFSLGFEIKKKNRLLIGRLAAILFIGISLLGFLFRPFYQTQTTDGVLLLTPGFKISQVDSLLKQNPHLKLMRTTDCDEVKNALLIEDDFFEKRGGAVKIILGEGLSSSALEMMPNKNFQFLPTEPEGVVKIFFEDEVIEHHEGMLKGIVSGLADTRLRLIGPAGTEDSVQLMKGLNRPFTLSFWPRQNGKFIYQLEITTGNRSYREPVPIDVAAESPLQILFIQKFPTAETRNLKNFLSERNHSLTLRYQISKEAYTYEYINTPQTKINPISRESLRLYDLLFIDVATLHSLTQNEKIELKNAVKNGLGVLVMLTDDPKNLQWLWPLQFVPSLKDTAHIVLSKKYTIPTVSFDITPTQDIYTVLASGPRNISGYILQGYGRIAFTLLQETYKLNTEGNTRDYSKTWSELISKVARKKNTAEIKINTPFPYYTNNPFEAEVISPEPVSLFADSIQVPLKEDLVVDDFWHTRIWAGKPGWHELRTKDASLSYFVPSDDSWKSLRAANRVLETKKAVRPLSTTANLTIEKKEISSLIFFLLFLFSAGFLWLAPKL
ncbi:MAG: hypothetical protein OJF59_000533 [Cytophagales bacterium]|jgi:hypothetical protein|nr:hypothetical protein [Bacteroidota bacterium]MBS1981405.1 hypothetical protein [Bacteroidota bacterium]WHZ06780.1 MAG: hypothetical protein OJF59_000533 [Cytophagales bacterium]